MVAMAGFLIVFSVTFTNTLPVNNSHPQIHYISCVLHQKYKTDWLSLIHQQNIQCCQQQHIINGGILCSALPKCSLSTLPICYAVCVEQVIYNTTDSLSI